MINGERLNAQVASHKLTEPSPLVQQVFERDWIEIRDVGWENPSACTSM